MLVYYTIGYDFTVKAKSKQVQVLDGCFIWPCAVERTSHDTHQPGPPHAHVCKVLNRDTIWVSSSYF